MRISGRLAVGTGIFAALCAGCSSASAPFEVTGEAASRSIIANGAGLNVDPPSPPPPDLPFDGFRMRGERVARAFLERATVRAELHDGTPLAGQEIGGAELDATSPAGPAITLRIDAVTLSADQAIARYAVSYQLADGTGPRHQLCGADSSGDPILAIPLAGSWDPSSGAHSDESTTFTLACEGYGLAKCVDLGYRPWQSSTECDAAGACHEVSLAYLHQACTRMLRADFCGDGSAATEDGTPVDVFDNLGIQADLATSWQFEAEWGVGGATCVSSPRWRTLPNGVDVKALILGRCPQRWHPAGCGGAASTFHTSSGFHLAPEARSLLMTRAQQH